MRRFAPSFLAATILAASGTADATSCGGPTKGLTRWIEEMAASADSVVLATVVTVSSPSTGMWPSAKVRVVKRLKGNGNIDTVKTSAFGLNFRLVPNDTRVFFVGKDGVLLSCSEYRHAVTDSGLQFEVERILGQDAASVDSVETNKGPTRRKPT